jgi:hypothetical protein
MKMNVKAFCGCREEEGGDGDVPQTLVSELSLHSLEYLYFCRHCQAIRCRHCVDEDIVVRFCPSCLFEVVELQARASSNTCIHNCLQCPSCNSSVTATAVDDASYKIGCNFCDWKSDLVLIKRALTDQVRKLRATTPQYLQFKQLQEFVKKNVVRLDNPKLGLLETDQTSSSGLESDERCFDDRLSLPVLRRLRAKTSKRCKIVNIRWSSLRVGLGM